MTSTDENGTAVTFGVVGLDHGHVVSLVLGLLGAGAECAGYWSETDTPWTDVVAQQAPHLPRVSESAELLENPDIDLIVTAAVPARRAEIAVEALRHGKDVVADKPGAITLDQLAQVRAAVAESGRFWSVAFSERTASRATLHARRLIEDGAIGRVVQTLGLGPHHLRPQTRPAWTFDPALAGGILADLASHQVDQFLYLTGSTSAEVVSSSVGNFAHPDRPGFEDFGEMLLRSDHAQGYARVDWYTPDGLGAWGDVRLTILGTEGYIEIRKNIDLGGAREGGDHLFLVDGKGTRHLESFDVELPYFRAVVDDVRHRRTPLTAIPQDLVLTATELALTAQRDAARLGNLR
ncbi:Gfo/Idh/MocA family oxidoreductase [Actinopolymorpha sp. B11F2]|uniref:Gfo/Idh/MocA family protein n=1 Tax=Actinopolymorpha sp. B11F2 TaxID=3160862 RepID=UPI0032E44E3E